MNPYDMQTGRYYELSYVSNGNVYTCKSVDGRTVETLTKNGEPHRDTRVVRIASVREITEREALHPSDMYYETNRQAKGLLDTNY